MSSKVEIFDEWRRLLEHTKAAATAKGCSPCKLVIGAPASEAEVVEVERELGRALPPSFRRALTQFAGSLELFWMLPDSGNRPEPFSEIFAGCVQWDIAQLRELNPDLEETYDVYLEEYARVWQKKLLFHKVSNGDCYGLDIATDGDGAAVFLSHDGADSHGYVLGANFIDAVDRLIRLGGVGSEDVQWLPFVSSPTSGTEPDGDPGRQWREWFGLP